jgi:outer membrane immunogenic protein
MHTVFWGDAMKKLAAIAVAVLVGTPAFAADIAVKAPPAAPSCYDWSGLYAGGHVGYLWGDSDWTYVNNAFVTRAGTTEETTLRQPFWGGHGGLLWQWGCQQGGNPVFGLEGSMSNLRENHETGFSNRFVPAEFGPLRTHDSIKWMDTIGVRVGWGARDTYLFTVNGGWARASVTSELDAAPPLPTTWYFARSTQTHNGWYFGATLEKTVYRFGNIDAILGAEYQFVHLNDARHCANFTSVADCEGSFGGPLVAGLPRDVRDINLDAHTIRVRLTFKWNPYSAGGAAGY